MTWQHTARSEAIRGASAAVQKTFDKQARLLAANIRNPSLRAKKYGQGAGLWQARVNRDWRFYFVIKGNEYIILTIVPHPK